VGAGGISNPAYQTGASAIDKIPPAEAVE